MRERLALPTGILLLAVLAPWPALAIDPVWSNWRGLALRGHDPVAYFDEARALPGSADHSLEWKGATWRFSSAERLERFRAEPGRYAPQYGGYCAYAVASGSTASVDPEAWRIVDGKLYLNYSRSIQAEWDKDVPGYIRRADESWPRLLAD